MIKTVFFGTHDFAVTILQSLIDAPDVSVDLVITQPDKPVGRKKVITPPPVKVLAENHGISVEQPKSLKKYELSDSFDVGVTAQYGLLVPEHILDAPTHGVLNVHTSLLPKYRGASPIQSALINGEAETGVTIMKMDVGLDTGPILLQKSLAIDPDDTYPILDAKLAQIGAEALLEALPQYVSGALTPQEQNNDEVTTCSQFSREDGEIDWSRSAADIYNQYRGMTPWPGIWTVWNDKRLKLLEVSRSDKSGSAGTAQVDGDTLYIGTSDGSIEVIRLQLEGKPATDAKSFIAGHSSIHNSAL